MGTTSEKYKGKAKRIEGQVTGDKLREAQGVAEELTAEVKGAVETIAQTARELAKKTSARVSELAERAHRPKR